MKSTNKKRTTQTSLLNETKKPKKDTIIETSFSTTKFVEEKIKLFKKYPFSNSIKENYIASTDNGVFWVCFGNKIKIWTSSGDDLKTLEIPITSEGSHSHISIVKEEDSSSIGLLIVTLDGEVKFWPSILEDLKYTQDVIRTDLRQIKEITKSKKGIVYAHTEQDLFRLDLKNGSFSYKKVEKSSGIFSWIPFINSKREIQKIHLGDNRLCVITTDNLEFWSLDGDFLSEIPLKIISDTLQKDFEIISISSFKDTVYLLTRCIEDEKDDYYFWEIKNYAFKKYLIDIYHPKNENEDKFIGIYPSEDKISLLFRNIYITFSKKQFEKYEIESIGGGMFKEEFIIFGMDSLLSSKEQTSSIGKIEVVEEHLKKYDYLLYQAFLQYISGHLFEEDLKITKESMIEIARTIIDMSMTEGSKPVSLILQQLLKKERVWESYIEFLYKFVESNLIPIQDFYEYEIKLKFAIGLRNLNFIGNLDDSFKKVLSFAIEKKEKNSNFLIEDFYTNISKIDKIFQYLIIDDKNSAYIVGKIYEILIEIIKEKKYNSIKLWTTKLRDILLQHIKSYKDYIDQSNEFMIYEMVDYYLYSCQIENDSNFNLLKSELVSYFNGEYAINLAQKYQVYDVFIKNSKMEEINKYLNEKQNDEFLRILFDELSIKGRVKDLLNVAKRYPNEFEKLIGNRHRYKWLHDIQIQKYQNAEESLICLAREEPDFNQKKKFLSLAKLSSLIDENQSNQKLIQDNLLLCNSQQKLIQEHLIEPSDSLHDLTELIRASIKTIGIFFNEKDVSRYFSRLQMAFQLYLLLDTKNVDLLTEIYNYSFKISFPIHDISKMTELEIEDSIHKSIYCLMANHYFNSPAKLTREIHIKVKDQNKEHEKTLNYFWETYEDSISIY